MKKKSVALTVFFVTLGMLVGLSGCDNLFGGNTDDSTKKAKLVYPEWADGIAYTNLAKVVLENKMDYDCEITPAGVSDAFKAVADGEQDAFMEAWTTLHQDYFDKYSGKIEDLTAVYDGTLSGLVVPNYVHEGGLTSIEELDAYKGQLEGEIQGIDPGAGIMKTVEENVLSDSSDPYYNISDYDLLEADGPAMISELDTAIDNDEEWIVVTLWKPHWAFAKYDLEFLDDPEGVWSEGEIHIYGRSGLGDDKPELKKFLQNMSLTNSKLSDLMLKIQNRSDSETIETVAKTWMEENSTLIDGWIPN